MSPIDLIRPPTGIAGIDIQPSGKTPGSGGGFASALSDAMGGVNQGQQASNTTIDQFLSGEGQEVHQVALATQRAELAFELFLQVRNKVVQAYQEVMRMQM
jgi:flagellar hook-basal body complex protein FliE